MSEPLQLIVTHEAADFDALAAATAAHKLYPDASIVLGRSPARDVREFLALHKDRFHTLRPEDIDEARVTRLVIVDVRRRSRLSAFPGLVARIEAKDPTLELHVFDHHPASDDDIAGSFELIEPVGSTTTLLVELLRARAVQIDEVDATLFALGIHADTGSLTYANTTARDAAALAWLLGAGARLDVLNRYLRPGFSPAQRQALAGLLTALTTESVGGLRIGSAAVELDELPDGLADVTSEGAALSAVHAFIAAYTVAGAKTQLIARSQSPLVDVGQMLSVFGGGGHPTAASAVVRGEAASTALESVLAALRQNPPRATRVCELMSSPVRTLSHDVPLSQARDELRSRGHTGAPVLRDGKLAGIISWRDIERAKELDQLQLPVSSCMTQRVLTAKEEESLEAALERMTRADVGRLPVLRGRRLVGIITRADVLAALYGRGH